MAMKKVLISYGNQPYYKSLEALKQSAIEIGGVDQCIIYTRDDIEKTDFYIKNKFILDQPRGNGYWLWKAFILMDTFSKLEWGDCVIYSDAGLKVIDNLDPLYKASQEAPGNRLVFSLPNIGVQHKLKNWCKRDCLILMNADTPEFYNSQMINGAVSVWMKTPDNEEILKEWRKLMRDPRVLTDSPNICGKPNYTEFKDHRHDQSVLSILAIRGKWELFRDPTQWGNSEINLFTNSTYPQLFFHHRQKL